MGAESRRKEIAQCLMTERRPVSGGELSERFHVSRQIIVKDIGLLKAAGYGIEATHYGYVMKKNPLVERVFKVRHTKEQTEEELACIVGLGGAVVDVFVWHKVYGRIEAKLDIYTQKHVESFMDGVRSGRSTELMSVTDGYHYHTVRAESEATLDRIAEALGNKRFLAAGD